MSDLGIETEAGRNPLFDQADQHVLDGFRLLGLHEVEVGEFCGRRRQPGQLAMIDGVSRGDDPALAGLPKNLRQSHDRHDLGSDQVGQHRAGAHRGELVRIADQNDAGSAGDGPQDLMSQHHIHHRRFVQNEQVAGERMLRVAS